MLFFPCSVFAFNLKMLLPAWEIATVISQTDILIGIKWVVIHKDAAETENT